MTASKETHLQLHAQLWLESILRCFLFSCAQADSQQRQCERHSVAGIMLFASQLRRFRGCAAEACFRALAMARFRNVLAQRPAVYYVKDEKTHRSELRRDENILNEMWQLTQQLVATLEAQGVRLKWAQSTYARKTVDGDKSIATRTRRSQFSVDLTVMYLNKTVWLEFKYTEAEQWSDSLSRAGSSVSLWKEILKRPENWKLDSNLSGATLQPPDAMGTLIASFDAFRLEIKEWSVILESVAQAPADHRPLRKRPPREVRSQEELKAKKTRVLRKQRKHIRASGAIYKKPSMGVRRQVDLCNLS